MRKREGQRVWIRNQEEVKDHHQVIDQDQDKVVHQEEVKAAHQDKDHQAKAVLLQAWDQAVHHQAKEDHLLATEDLHQAWKVAHLQLKWAHHQAEATHWVASDASNKI